MEKKVRLLGEGTRKVPRKANCPLGVRKRYPPAPKDTHQSWQAYPQAGQAPKAGKNTADKLLAVVGTNHPRLPSVSAFHSRKANVYLQSLQLAILCIGRLVVMTDTPENGLRVQTAQS